MVDTEGPVEVSSQTSNNQRGETRKVDQIIFELTQYGVSVGALQETKWFGDAVYEMNGSVLLTAGRPTPAVGVPIQRGEGAALVLLGSALVVWRRGVQGVFQHFWNFLVMLGGFTYCPVMHLLGLLVGRIRTSF